MGEYSNLCKTLDWGIRALRENHLNHTTGRHCSMCNCGLRNTETTLVSNIQLCSVSSLPKAACFASERDLAPYLALSRGESCHCTVTWVEGVAIKFLPSVKLLVGHPLNSTLCQWPTTSQGRLCVMSSLRIWFMLVLV